MTEEWLSIVEYARTYSISDMTVRRRIKTGKLRAVLREGKYYIPVHEVGAPSADFHDDDLPVPKPRPMASKPAMNRPIVKAHPTPQTSYMEHAVPEAPKVSRAFASPTANHVPPQIRTSLATNEKSTVETQTLLAFCDNALRKLGDAEQKLGEHYKTKIMQLEAQLQAKELEANHLSQQVEDLQVLVKILERKK